MPHPKNADYQRGLRERRREAGLVRVHVYVHESRREELLAAAAMMQEPKER